MRQKVVLSCFLLFLCLQLVSSIDPTCRGKRVREICAKDEDCEGQNIKCVQGKCACPQDFDEVVLTERISLCKPVPTKISDTCKSTCKPPLLCQSAKCECTAGAKASGSTCTYTCPAGQQLVGQDCRKIITDFSSKCGEDADCQIPNSYCSSRFVCDCIPGATKSGSSCVLNCPDGTAPTKTCTKILLNDANALANGDKMDSCPKGYLCTTYGKPDIGHCCKQYCPYGAADLTKSCVAGAGSDKCPSTHYCQTFETNGAKTSICCPRPCQPPTPLYINGRCLPVAHWGDACKDDGECEGGSTMDCKNGKCVCTSGFNQVNTTFPTCQKTCNILSQAKVGGACRDKVSVGDACLTTAMCPARSVCREGKCICDCNSALSANKCIDPEDPGGTGKITDALNTILGQLGGSGGTGGNTASEINK